MMVSSLSEFNRILEAKPEEIRVVGTYADTLWREYKEARKKQKDPRGYLRRALWKDTGDWMSNYKLKSYRTGELVFERFPYFLYAR